jgi:hypothetical protein
MATAPGRLLTPAAAGALEALGAPGLVAAVLARAQDGALLPLLDAAAAAVGGPRGGPGAVVVLEAELHGPTGEAVRAWCAQAGEGPRRLALTPRVPLGGADAHRTLLAVAARPGVTAALLLDGDLVGLPGEALAALLDPVARGTADAALPAYTRLASEGTLTSNLLAPAMLAFYGRDLQQVAGGAFALGPDPAGRLAGAAPPAAAGPGVEVWLTTALAASEARLAQVHVGRRPPGPPGAGRDVAGILAAAAGALFAQLETHATLWETPPERRAVTTLGGHPAIVPVTTTPDVSAMVRAFRLGVKDLSPVWEQVMPEATLGELYPLALLEPEEFRLPPALWARVVADFAVAYHERRLPVDHLLRALTPLYLGRVAAFLLAVCRRSADTAASALAEVTRAFEMERPALAARWR